MPTVKTAFLGIDRIRGINHFTSVRMRVVGSGELDMSLLSQDGVRSTTLTPFTMAANTSITPSSLTNFNTQRAQLQLSTDEINEIFRINRIIIYARPTAVDYPG